MMVEKTKARRTEMRTANTMVLDGTANGMLFSTQLSIRQIGKYQGTERLKPLDKVTSLVTHQVPSLSLMVLLIFLLINFLSVHSPSLLHKQHSSSSWDNEFGINYNPLLLS
jgi:hypothetical protein